MIKNDAVKKIEYDKLIAKVNSIQWVCFKN